MSNDSNTHKKRSRQLDFLRGVAILLVLAIHLRLEIPKTPVVGPVFEFFNRIGWVGVDLFFVLSGFLVGGLLITEINKYGKIDPKRFLIRRGLKIYPLYYVFFGYLFFMPMAKAAMGGDPLLSTFSGLWEKYWPNLLFLNGYIGDNPIGHTWTLAIEEHFYLILPFLLLLLSYRLSVKGISIVCALILVPVVAYRFYAVYHPDILVDRIKETHFRIDALFVGVAIRGLADACPAFFASMARYRFALCLAGYLALSYVPFMPNQEKLTTGYLLTTVGSAAILIGTFQMRLSDLPAFLQTLGDKMVALFCWIGAFSYSIYVWHVTLFRILERQVETRLGFSADSENAMILWILYAFSICVIAILASALISRLVEIPVLKFRDRFFPSRSTSIPTASR